METTMTQQAADAIAKVKAAAAANGAVLLSEHENPERGMFARQYCLTYRTASNQSVVYIVKDDGQISRAAI
jgi:hypothetical protein